MLTCNARSPISVVTSVRLSFGTGTRDSSIVGMLTGLPNLTPLSHGTSEGFRGGRAMDGRMTNHKRGCR